MTEEPLAAAAVDDSYIVVIGAPTMGIGDDVLGKTLLKTFIYSLTEQDVLPDAVIFITAACLWSQRAQNRWKICKTLPTMAFPFTLVAHALIIMA